MELIYYTIAALLLYGISDYILNTIEIRIGKRLRNRSLVFLVIIAVLSISSFSIIQAIFQKPESTKVTADAQLKPMEKESVPAATAQSLAPSKENNKASKQ